MAKNDARSQLTEPKVVVPPGITPEFVAAFNGPLVEEYAAAAAGAPHISPTAARAIGDGAGLAKEYARAAADLCARADRDPVVRANVRRLLKLALAHLDG